MASSGVSGNLLIESQSGLIRPDVVELSIKKLSTLIGGRLGFGLTRLRNGNHNNLWLAIYANSAVS